LAYYSSQFNLLVGIYRLIYSEHFYIDVGLFH